MLEDVNDEIPLFTEREQETVLEGEPIGTKVTQVNAIDKDGTFPNNQVSEILQYCCCFCENRNRLAYKLISGVKKFLSETTKILFPFCLYGKYILRIFIVNFVREGLIYSDAIPFTEDLISH